MSSKARELYYLWEQQQWEAGKIELSRDHSAPFRDVMETLLVVKDALTSGLVPFVDVIPDEEDQVFLSTELVDEARHAVFFDRVLSDVLGIAGSMESRVEAARQSLNVAWKERIQDLHGASTKVRSDGVEALRDGVRVTHIEIKGAARGLLDVVRASAGSMPGLLQGLEFVQRDEDRHLAFAQALLGD